MACDWSQLHYRNRVPKTDRASLSNCFDPGYELFAGPPDRFEGDPVGLDQGAVHVGDAREQWPPGRRKPGLASRPPQRFQLPLAPESECLPGPVPDDTQHAYDGSGIVALGPRFDTNPA